MRSRETTTVLRMTSMPVLVTLALLLLLVLGSIAVTTTRATSGAARGSAGNNPVAVEPQHSGAVLHLNAVA
ncbi:MAG TPA: hypothetical protein GX714_09760 [Chloroflexi bacterium]|jgi:TRAP-type mannitol/chloroaromatic compound transport system permease large subunit|nr:hypothetical protein [Chloroflexota bacterium]